MRRALWKRCVAEAVGTFALTFLVAGAICADRYSGGQIGLLGVALAYGAGTAAMMYATSGVSGGHLNPALTFAAAVDGRTRPSTACLYVAAQLTGATTAGLMLVGLYTPEIWQPVSLGTPTLRPEVAFSTGTFLEAVMTFFLVFTALRMTADERAPDTLYGLAIGAVLIGDVLAGGALTGAAVNPARAFGPALASGTWTNHLAYWVGPIGGGFVAALVHRLVQPRKTS